MPPVPNTPDAPRRYRDLAILLDAWPRLAPLLTLDPGPARVLLGLWLYEHPLTHLLSVLDEGITALYGVDLGQVRARGREGQIRDARVAWYYCLLRLGLSVEVAGQVLFRDHSTVLHSRNALRDSAPRTDADGSHEAERVVVARHCEPLVRRVLHVTQHNRQRDIFNDAAAFVPDPATAFRYLAYQRGVAPAVIDGILDYLGALVGRTGAPICGALGLWALAQRPTLRRAARAVYQDAGAWPVFLDEQLALQARAAGYAYVA